MKIKVILTSGLLTVLWSLGGCSPEKQTDTLFTLITPGQSNVYFKNEVRDTEEYNTLFHANFYGGGGVGIGDINNDGLMDLYFTGNQVADKLYVNKGGLEFEDITGSAGIIDDSGWSSSVLLGDVNRDGFLDIYVTREMLGSSPELMRNKLYLNNQDETFSEVAQQWGVDNDQRSRAGTFLDYDNDGDLDLYLLNTPPNPGPLVNTEIEELLLDRFSAVLYENQGSRFVDVTRKSGLKNTGFPNSVVAADINGDGYQDLYVTHDFSIPDCIYMNNQDGTFTNKINEMTGHISFGSMGVDAADINNDGLLDIFVTDMSAEDNYRIKANMGGMNPEAFWKVVDRGDHYQYMYNTLQLNTGFQKFSEVAQIAGMATSDWSWSSFFADFDNDGHKDAFVANGVIRDIRNTDALNKLSRQVGIPKIRLINNDPQSIDENRIASSELAAMLELFPSEKLINYIYKNNGDFTFTKKMEEWGLTFNTFTNGSAYGDLDNDGDLDLVVNNSNDYAQIFENHAVDNGAHFLRIKLSDRSTNQAITGTKVWLYADRGMQFFEVTGTRGMYSSSEQMVHFGLADNSEVKSLRIKWPNGREYTISNPEIDQLLEVDYQNAVEVTSQQSDKGYQYFQDITDDINIEVSHIENDFDDYELQVLLPHKMSTYGPGLATGDVNGDGNEDFYLGGAAGYPGQLVLQNDNGEFTLSSTRVFESDQNSEDTGAGFFDSDGDGDLDLYVVSGGNEYPVGSVHYRDRLYLNDGTGNFSRAKDALPDIRISGSKVYPYDFDNDQDLDLFIGGHHIPGNYPAPASSVLLMNQQGRYSDVTSDMAPGLIEVGIVNDAVWVDIDNDQRKDLVLVGEWMPVTIFKNKETGFVEVSHEYGLQNSSGWWFSVDAADINGDGHQDLVAGNLGLNYKYQASLEEPFKVYYDDFDLNGSKDIVLAYYNFGDLFPLRGRSCSSEQVPQLKEKFGTYDLFAQSDLETVYGTQNLDHALQYQATTFASAYFINDGNSQFKMHSLPMEAQFSSVNDILIFDANQDDSDELLIAGNLYNAEIETTRNDAGYSLMLERDGKGEFKAITARESGLFLPYEVKQLALIKGSSGDFLLAACNNDNLRILRWHK